MKSESKIASFFRYLFIEIRELKPLSKIEAVIAKMNLAEKIFFYIFACICIISSLVLLFRVNDYFLIEIPSFGGKFTEGVVGSPRFINPVLAISDTDKDLTSLVYSGLLKSTKTGLINDLAESYEIKENGTVYDFKIKPNAYFQDGSKVTTDDIIFTINKILDPIIKSPRYNSWQGVSLEKISDSEIRFILNKPYNPFLEALTIGILPKHIWEKASSEEFPFSNFNIQPIGSGPYQIKKNERNSSGILKSITLSSFHQYTLGRPKIDTINFVFFQNETELLKAFKDQTIENISGLSPILAKDLNSNLFEPNIVLPRVFGVFFNQNLAPLFINKEVREALSLATPKKEIIDTILYGFGKPLNGPTPANTETNPENLKSNPEKAKNILLQNGWKENSSGILEKKTKTGTTLLSFSITTSDSPELKKTAEILKTAWEKIGAQVNIKVFEAGDLSQNIIRGRKYEALLFGEIITDNSDLYPFWHSSERNDPGLNISLYANINVDKNLEELQKNPNLDNQSVKSKREIIFNEINQDNPAIFLFSPQLIYVKSNKIKNLLLKNISFNNERFLDIQNWYINTDKVWKIFQPK